jgi:hypothetical protein
MNVASRSATSCLGAIAVIALFAGSAAAQANNCTWNGQEYAEGTTVCQNGLRQLCMNGTWQNNDGERCQPGEGAAAGLRMLEQEEQAIEE